MQEIADGAELSKATLYLYFPSKEALLTAILDEAASTFVQYVRERIRPDANGLEAIHALWSGYLDFFGESEDVFILTGIGRYVNPDLPLAIANKDPEGNRPIQKIFELIAELLRRGVEDGTLEASVDPEKTTSVVITVATSIIDQMARLPRRKRDNRMSRTLLHDSFEILLRGLASRDADAALLILP
jgi:AcrR family transcriptional regulator